MPRKPSWKGPTVMWACFLNLGVNPRLLSNLSGKLCFEPSQIATVTNCDNSSIPAVAICDLSMWDDMEEPMPSAAQRCLTNPFLTPLEVRPLLDESLSSDGYVPQGFTRMGNQTVAQQPQQPGVGVMGNVAPVSDQQSGDGGMWAVIPDLRGQFEALLQETRQSRVALRGAEIHGAGAVREMRSDYAGRTDDMVAGHQRGPLGDGGPWARGTPDGSLGQPQAQFWRGDGRPTNFPYVAGAGVLDDRSREVRPVISDMEGEWAAAGAISVSADDAAATVAISGAAAATTSGGVGAAATISGRDSSADTVSATAASSAPTAATTLSGADAADFRAGGAAPATTHGVDATTFSANCAVATTIFRVNAAALPIRRTVTTAVGGVDTAGLCAVGAGAVATWDVDATVCSTGGTVAATTYACSSVAGPASAGW